jgi:DNA-binding Lrp family transcriptional regulator
MLQLDDLDIRILRELNGPGPPQWNVRESFTAIARRLGVDEETVRLRVARLRDRGVVPAWRIAVNPRLLGYEETGLDLEVEDEPVKPEVLSVLRTLPGITQVADFQGPGLLTFLWHDRPDVVSWLRRQIDPVGAWRLRASWTSQFPEPTIKMRTVDWRILAAMRDDARKDLRTVASTAGTTVRTVQRRLSALKEGKAAFVVGTPNVDRAAGLICNYLVYCPDTDRKRAADATVLRVLPRIGMSDSDSDHYSMFGGPCENLSQAEQRLAQLRSLYGVDTVRMAIVRQIFSADDWLSGLLRERAHRAPGPTSRARVDSG